MTLIESIASYLRGAIGPAFGDDRTDEGCKLYADFAAPVGLPYAVAYEVGESYTFMTRNAAGINYLADGQIQLEIRSGDRHEARQLGVLVAATLDDAEALIPCDEGPLMLIRVTGARFTPYGEVGPDGVSTVFLRSLTIQYQQSRVIGHA